MIDNPVEDGLSPGGCSAKLFQDHRRHAPVKSLQVIPLPLSICPALGHFFSEKFLGHHEIGADSVNLHVHPELGALWFNHVNICAMDGTYTARGGLPILLDLIWNEPGLLSSGCKSSLPGKLSLTLRSVQFKVISLSGPKKRHFPGPKSAPLGAKALQTSFLTLYQCKLVSRSAFSNPKIALICPPQISTYLAPKSADNLTCCDGGQSMSSV